MDPSPLSNHHSPPLIGLLYPFCRLQLPAVRLPEAKFERHLRRTFELYRAKRARAGEAVPWEAYLDNLHPVDWFLCCGCLEGEKAAWEALFAPRAHPGDCLLV